MTIEIWDRQPLGDQEDFVGRTKGSGAPLSGGTEFTEPDFDMPGSDGAGHRRATRTSGWRTPTSTTAPGCCAAATTSSTAPTRSAAWTPGCSSSRTSRDPRHPLHPDPERDGEVATR